MILFKRDTQAAYIKLPNQPESLIIRWETWFQTPVGLTDKIEDAIGVCNMNDLSADLMIRPVNVAISEDGSYEVSSR